jgi:hypothetical protein
MKYIATILVIICSATLLTLYFVWPEKPLDSANVAVTINGRQLAKSTVAAEEARTGYHSGDHAALLDSAITRELLIQEAQRLDLDKEESFRLSLKTFYEESLIKTLMDRQYAGPTMDVSDAEIDAYLALYGKMVTFTRLPVTDSPSPVLASDEGPQNEVLFDDLAEPLKCLLSGLKPGGYAMKFDTGNEQYAIRLDAITPSPTVETSLPQREHIRQLLADNKRQQQIGNWLNELRKKASITIHNG